MSDGSGTSVVRRYYLYRLTNTAGFISPVFTLFLLVRGLSFTQIGTLSAVYAVLVVAWEVPTGYVGDRIGRRNSLVLSKLFATASLWGFVAVHSFVAFLVVYALWALAMTFRSGSASAWLYDTLRAELDEDAFTRIEGRGGAVAAWATAGMTVVGALLYVVDPVIPFVAGGFVGLVGVGVVLSMPENVQFTDDGERESYTILEVWPVLRGRLARPPLRSFVLYLGLLFGIVGAANQYIQPITVDVLEVSLPALRVAGVVVPEEATLGVLYAGFTAVAAIASYHAGTVEAAVGIRRTVIVVPAAVALLFLAPAFVPVLALPTFFLMRASTALVRPMADRYVNDRVDSVGRATVLSAASMVYGLARTPFVFAAGVVADVEGVLAALPVLGAAFLALAAVLFLVESPVGHETSDAAVD